MAFSINSLYTTESDVASYQKRISICLLTNGFSFSITTQDYLLTFGEVSLDMQQPLGDLIADIKSFFASQNIDTFGFKSMRLVIMSNQCVWIPQEIYDSSRENQYLTVVAKQDLSLGMYRSFQKQLDSWALFTADTTVVTAFRVALPGIDVCCQHNMFVNDDLLARSLQYPLMLMNVRVGKVDIEAFYNGKLLLSNSYSYANGQQLLFSSIGVMKQLNLETPNMQLAICGQVDRSSYEFLQHYFPNVVLYTGNNFQFLNPELQTLHTYRHAAILC